MSLREPGKPYPIKDNQEQLLILMPELTYFVVMLNLLSNLVEGTHTVNIGKCRQVH